MKRNSAVIFDLDGTLTRPYLDFDAIRKEIGIQKGPVLEALASMEPAPRQRAVRILEQREWEAARGATLQDDAVHVIDTCRQAGFPVAILTRNTRPILDHILTRFGICVDAVRTREDGATKPSAEPVLALCDLLGANASHSWMVGDYLFDIISGRDAGARTVLMIGDGERPPFAEQADHVIRSLRELLPLIGAR